MPSLVAETVPGQNMGGPGSPDARAHGEVPSFSRPRRLGRWSGPQGQDQRREREKEGERGEQRGYEPDRGTETERHTHVLRRAGWARRNRETQKVINRKEKMRGWGKRRETHGKREGRREGRNRGGERAERLSEGRREKRGKRKKEKETGTREGRGFGTETETDST